MWQYSGSSHWRTYSRRNNDALEAAFRQGEGQVRLTVGRGTMTADLRKMQQLGGPAPRLLRRTDPLHGGRVAGRIPPSGWQYQRPDDGAWQDFHSVAARIVDRAYQSGQAGAWYRVRGAEYAVSFRDMLQNETSTGAVRPVRRKGGDATVPFFRLPGGTPVGAEQIPMAWSSTQSAEPITVELLGVPGHELEAAAVARSFQASLRRRVVSIQRVQNLSLWRQYTGQRRRKETTAKLREEFMWCGSAAIDAIVQRGFRMALWGTCPAKIREEFMWCGSAAIDAIVQRGFRMAPRGTCRLHARSANAARDGAKGELLLVRASLVSREEVDESLLYPAYVVGFEP